MFGRALRVVLWASFTLALWTFARPARAMPAGICDDRGATGIAPPPALQVPDTSIDRARSTVPCDDDRLPGTATVSRTHRAGESGFAASDCAAPPPARVAVVPAVGGPLEASPVRAAPARGTRSRVERPPRG